MSGVEAVDRLDSHGLRDLAGQQAVVLGLARQGTALARFLAEAGVQVTVSDLRKDAALKDALEALADLPIRYVLGKHPTSMLRGADVLFLSGGVPLDTPIVVEAVKRGIPLSNDAQIFLERCPAPVIGITGAAGKTTTTALVGEMCRVDGRRYWVGGNIGNPLLSDLAQIGPDDWVVMELSSFQLEIMTVSPHVGAILNVTPNHLDRHKTMETYIAAKRNIIAHQRSEDFALLGYDDAAARALALDTAAQLVWFSDRAEVEQGAFKTNGELTLRWQGADRVICHTEEVRLRGRHNLRNVLAASALAATAGVELAAMREVAQSFAGVEHRMEIFCERNGVQWVDDSIATAPERSVAALHSFSEPIILLAGGRDKQLPWGEFAEEAVQRVKQLITFGESGPMIARVVEQRLGGDAAPAGERALQAVTQVGSLEEAVELASRLAQPGDVVLLSPGGTSFDAFRDFAERGDRFKALVRGL